MSPDDIRDLLAEFGPVTVRRMFGGAGIYANGLMFALVSEGVVYFKADEASIAPFEREGCGPFVYETRQGRRALTSYWRIPDRLYDDPEEMADWARVAYAVASRAWLRERALRQKKSAGATPKRSSNSIQRRNSSKSVTKSG